MVLKFVSASLFLTLAAQVAFAQSTGGSTGGNTRQVDDGMEMVCVDAYPFAATITMPDMANGAMGNGIWLTGGIAKGINISQQNATGDKGLLSIPQSLSSQAFPLAINDRVIDCQKLTKAQANDANSFEMRSLLSNTQYLAAELYRGKSEFATVVIENGRVETNKLDPKFVPPVKLNDQKQKVASSFPEPKQSVK